MLSHMLKLFVQWGQSPIWDASFDGHEKCVKLLIRAGANVDVPEKVSITIAIPLPQCREHPCI